MSNNTTVKRKRIKVMQIPSGNLNLTEIVRKELKRAVHKQIPAKHNDLKRCCKEECEKDSPAWGELSFVK